MHLYVEEDDQGVPQIQQGGVALDDDNNTPLQNKMEEKSGHVEVAAEYFELRLPVVLLELLALLVLC